MPTVLMVVAWLAGCWEFTRGTQHVTEQWMRPVGASLLGMSRTTSEGRTVAYEFLLIQRRGGRARVPISRRDLPVM
jgi:hypothetical protein